MDNEAAQLLRTGLDVGRVLQTKFLLGPHCPLVQYLIVIVMQGGSWNRIPRKCNPGVPFSGSVPLGVTLLEFDYTLTKGRCFYGPALLSPFCNSFGPITLALLALDSLDLSFYHLLFCHFASYIACNYYDLCPFSNNNHLATVLHTCPPCFPFLASYSIPPPLPLLLHFARYLASAFPLLIKVDPRQELLILRTHPCTLTEAPVDPLGRGVIAMQL